MREHSMLVITPCNRGLYGQWSLIEFLIFISCTFGVHVSVFLSIVLFLFRFLFLLFLFPFLASSSKGVRRVSQKWPLKIVAVCIPVRKDWPNPAESYFIHQVLRQSLLFSSDLIIQIIGIEFIRYLTHATWMIVRILLGIHPIKIYASVSDSGFLDRKSVV